MSIIPGRSARLYLRPTLAYLSSRRDSAWFTLGASPLMQAALACPASDFIVAAVAVLTTTGFCICISLAGHRRVHGAIFLVLLVCSQVYTSSCTIHKLASLQDCCIQAFTFLELNWVALLVAYTWMLVPAPHRPRTSAGFL